MSLTGKGGGSEMKKKNKEWTQEQQRVDDIIRKIQQKQKELFN